MPVKLTSRERRIIVVAIAVAALSLVIGIKYFSRAFPEASLNLRVNRTESRSVAEQFLASRGFHPDGYRHAAIFQYDDQAKLYLERTQGLAKMNQLARGPVHLWRWSNRWFKPQQKEEFRVEVSTQGQVVGFDHEIPEAAPGVSLAPDAARIIARDFLRDVMHRDLTELEFVDSESEKRPARTDHTFTWKAKNVSLGDGSYRIEVEVDGNQVAGYSEFVKIPDQWTRDYQSLRSRNISAQLVDEVLFVLLSLAMLVMLIRRLRDHDVLLRTAAGFGLVATLLYFLGQLNSFSLNQFAYQTTDSYSSFMAGYFLDAVLSALGVGAFIFLIVAAAEPLYRESFPRLASVRRTLSWSGLRSRSFFMANVVGITLTFFFFAYQTVFYLAADKLGAWAPSDIPFSNLLNTRIPWIAVLFVGFFPAVSEEMQFRAFGIPFLEKVFRSRAAGLIVAAFIWGFLHSAYPNQPFFIRGIEVGLGGIIVGIVMLRFGIFATLIWHYSVDALYTAFLLLRSSNDYLRISGGLTAGIMLIPLIVALIAYLRTGTFAEESDLTNESAGIVRAPKEETVAQPEKSLGYRPLAKSRILAAGILTAAFVGAAFMPAYHFGRDVELHFARRDAVRAASVFLEEQGVKPQAYRHVAWLDENVDPLALRYLLEHLSVRESQQVYRRATRLELWEVRFFKPLQKEEYRVFVDPTDNMVFTSRHILDEDAPGATLAPEAARSLAEDFLQRQGYQLSGFELQNSEARKRKAREDYTLTWQAKPGDPLNVADAHFRIAVDIAGDQVVSLSRYFKLPEEWQRQREASHLANAILLGLRSLLAIVFTGLAMIFFVRQVRAGLIPWRRSLWVGVAVAGLVALSELGSLPLFYQQYQTSISISNFWISVGASLVVFPLVVGILGWLVVGLATSFYPEAWKVFEGSARRVWRRDAIIAFILSLAARGAIVRFETFLADRFHAFAPVGASIFPEQFNTAYPGIAFILHALLFTVFYAALAGIAVYIVRLGWSRGAWWFWAAGALLFVSLGPASAHSVREFLVGWVLGLVPLVVAVLIAVYFFRDNFLAYVGAVLCLEAAGPLVKLLSQPATFFQWNGVLLLVLAIVVLGWIVGSVGKSARSSEPGNG
jgi:membrane protease YdiL (CAAX protease family)